MAEGRPTPPLRVAVGASSATKPAIQLDVRTRIHRNHRGDGASRTRTGDLLGAIQALSQLSYSPGRVTV
jgi:hypothetical protein